jgi:DeoR family ulaG and ulaABCDEF operon transcriptional repressor
VLEARRHQRILELLGARGVLGIHELCTGLGASEATVRRDLGKLQAAGSVRRVRGGAELSVDPPAPVPRAPYTDCPNQSAKRAIAARAAQLVQDGEVVLIDGGTTTYQLASYLEQRAITVLTNSFPLAEHLAHHGRATVVLPPGRIDRRHWMIADPFGAAAFAGYACRWAFMSVKGCDAHGVSNDDDSVIKLEREMLDQAEHLVLLVDASKFRQQGRFRLCTWDRVHTVIADDALRPADRALLADRGVQLITVPAQTP